LKKKAKIERTILAALILVAGTIWYSYVHSDLGSARAGSFLIAYKPIGAESPRLHLDRVQAARNTEYGSTVRDIFSREQPPPPPEIAPVPAAAAPVYVPPVPPPLPPPSLPLKFFGSGTVVGKSSRRAFLSNGESVYVAAEGDTLLGRYRIIKIGRANLEFEEIGTGRHGFTPLEDQEAPL
jgi:hypothetical protein